MIKVIYIKIIVLISGAQFSFAAIANVNEDTSCNQFIDSEIERLEGVASNLRKERKSKIDSFFKKYKAENTEKDYKIAYEKFNSLKPDIVNMKSIPSAIKIEVLKIKNQVCSKREKLVNLIDQTIMKLAKFNKSIILLAKTSTLQDNKLKSRNR